MRILLIDNYDSFTYNLAQLIVSVTAIQPLIIKNDSMTWDELQALDFDAVVISPGPGSPAIDKDFGLCANVIESGRWPTLGVCLGFQGIGYLNGAKIVHASEPMHGRLSEVHHSGNGLLKGIPSPFKATRYHSLMLEDIPDWIIVDAHTVDEIVMSLHVRSKMLWGVQFHPESISSEYGQQIIENFICLAESHLGKRRHPNRSTDNLDSAKSQSRHYVRRKFGVFFREATCPIETDILFKLIYGDSPYTYWLDSNSDAEERYSFMGDNAGPHSEHVSYNVNSGTLTVVRQGRSHEAIRSVFDYLECALKTTSLQKQNLPPIPLLGGYVGYLGYEMKAECGGDIAHSSSLPDAQYVFADRYLCVDHKTNKLWIICLDDIENEHRARDWVNEIFQRVHSYSVAKSKHPSGICVSDAHTNKYKVANSRGCYIDLISQALEYVRSGDSYEVCLTNQWQCEFNADPLEVYNLLRVKNAAPHSAFMRFSGVSVLCNSPERFVSISNDRIVESKPIKGTIRRSDIPEKDRQLKDLLSTSEKDQAENLMIVDLIRNDLNKVCINGSVKVPSFCAIESFSTVHQMVSTIVGELREECTVVDCIRALFPGGSMTGAPKVRTMKILDGLESVPRGIYSGALGYFSFNGTCDLNIVIRTVIINDGRAYIGAGGAITALSDPQQEYEETLLKSDVLRKTLNELS